MVLLILLFLSSIELLDSCVPTPSVPMPMPPPCSQLCTPAQLSVPPPIMEQPPSVSGACAIRTLRCVVPPVGGTTATITYNGGPGGVSGLGMVDFVVTCNGAGTAWTYMGTAVTSVMCTIT
ncbi:hypothetical protein PRIPAC_71003 [Pristionchus pacificus]|uniref:C6 domain-containing protein n=1 Tax=Pristionchus pacificus TaxID=54126 RepID=A0A2A6B5G3_PRIPA|nr:hypothetical protein PRIPAC_71003 [Pristionchus pacificus]|eukprot:PDM61116.1 hypothetical protein PRIPAC_54922 [Pristionchus pacificus]